MCHFSSFFWKNPFPLNKIEAQGKDDFAHRRHPAGLSPFDTIDGERRNPSFARQFSLAHEQALADFLDTIGHENRPSQRR